MDAGQEKLPPIEIAGPSGLSLKVDTDSRDPNSWQVLDNMDHYIDGSIRKVLPPMLYGGPYVPKSTGIPTTILNFIEYRFDDSSPLFLIGVGADGNLYDVTSGNQVGSLLAFIAAPLTVPPFLAVLPGVLIPYNFRIWQKNTAYAVGDAIIKFSATDGQLYIFSVTVPGNTGATEQAYPASGNVVDGGVTWTNQGLQSANLFQCNYLTITVSGAQPMKWESATNTVTQVGVSAPEVPANVKSVELSPNLDGYAPTVGSFYCYTLFNPRTLHESSPSPIAIQTQFFAIDQAKTIATPGSFLPVLPVIVANKKNTGNRSYQIVGIEVAAAALNPAVGQGFTHIRFYRTKDGGATFFLLVTLFDVDGNQITNSDGSVDIAMLTAGGTDYVPLPTPQSPQAIFTVYEGYGTPNLVAAPDTLDPNFWTDHSNGKIVVIEGDGNNGFNAFEYTGTGGASGDLYQGQGISGTTAVPYTIQAFVDATQQASGKIGVQIVHWDGTVVLDAPQANGTEGLVTATGNLGGVRKVFFHVYENGIVNNGLNVLWSNFILQKGATITPTGYPTVDAALVTPAPAPESAEAPPIAEWAAVYQGSFYVLDFADRTKVRFSDSIDFESFGTSSFLRFPTDTDDPVTCLSSTFNALIVGKRKSTQQILGSNFSNFTPTPIDPQHGILGKRALVAVGSSIAALLTEGLAIMGLALNISTGSQIETSYRPQGLLGDPVQPITKRIIPAALDSTICFAYDTTQGILLFAIQTVPGVGNNEMLMLTLGNSPKFSRYPQLPGNILTIREVELPTGQIAVLMSCTDGKVYWLFGGFPDTNPLIAFATTQALPTPSQMPREYWGEKKVFKEMWVDGQDITTMPGDQAIGNWMVSYQTDNGWWTIPIPLKNRNQVGREGQRLTIAFMHANPTCNVPLLTYWNIDWDIVGKTV